MNEWEAEAERSRHVESGNFNAIGEKEEKKLSSSSSSRRLETLIVIIIVLLMSTILVVAARRRQTLWFKQKKKQNKKGCRRLLSTRAHRTKNLFLDKTMISKRESDDVH